MVQIYCICNAGHGLDADESSGLSRGRRRLPDHGYRVLRTEKDIHLPISRRYGKARTKTCRATYAGPGDEAVPDAFAGTPAATISRRSDSTQKPAEFFMLHYNSIPIRRNRMNFTGMLACLADSDTFPA